MTRRESVRVVLFARARLSGTDRSVRCAIVDLSAAGAKLSLSARLPVTPLRLEFELCGEQLEFEVDVRRVAADGNVVVVFPRPRSERLYRVIAAEQRRALAQGRVNISERRVPPSFRSAEGETAQPPENSSR
jgi:hypothetical protein